MGIPGKLVAFFNTGLGTVLLGAVIGIIGLFTWQRQDWLFKERYYRGQVILERQVELVEQINTGIGRYLACADTAIAAVVKKVPPDQRSAWIDQYNAQQAEWFGARSVYASLLGFYFPSQVAEKFSEIVSATQQLDLRIYELTSAGGGDLSQARDAAYQSSRDVREVLQEWNDLALQHLQGDKGE
jgi:hypothetical protein